MKKKHKTIYLGAGVLTVSDMDGNEICSCETESQQLKLDLKFPKPETLTFTMGTANITNEDVRKALYGTRKK